MKRKDLPSIDYLHECFEYRDGKLYWKERPRSHFPTERGWKIVNTRCAGTEAGSLKVEDGRSRVAIKAGPWTIYRHILIWAFCHGEWPGDLEVDHINRDSSDDRIENLRLATHGQNMTNTKIYKNSGTGFKGVSFCKRLQKWTTRVTHNKKTKHLGSFDTPEEAHRRYMQVARKLHGEFFSEG